MDVKKLLTLVMLLFSGILGAQEYDLKEHMRKLENKEPIPYMKDGVYIRDISGVLRPFIGTWVGRHKQYAYVLSIQKRLRYAHGSAKYRFDELYAQYQVYTQSSSGDWYVEEGTGIGGVHDNYLDPRKYHNPRFYTFTYGGAILERDGLMILAATKEHELEVYLVSHPAFGRISPSQVFPVYEKDLGLRERARLCRVGDANALFFGAPEAL